ncbi:MAG: lamin tail domain-containing protein [Myxococcota bacterium]
MSALRTAVALLLWLTTGCLDDTPAPFPAHDGADGGMPRPGRGVEPLAWWPADGTWGVPPELPLAAVRFPSTSAEPLPEVSLRGPAGDPLPARVEARPCSTLGFGGGRCVALVPGAPLTPQAAHRLVVGDGSRPGWTSRFATAPAGDTPPARWLSPECALDEQPAGPGCLLAFDDRAVLRLQGSAPLRLWLSAGSSAASAVAPRGDATLWLRDLEPGCDLRATLRSADLLGRQASLGFELPMPSSLPPVFITEVRADALGPEPGQEYVEVVNSGDVPIDLQGFSLSDAPHDEGDVVAEPAVVPAGGRALLVPARFDPQDPDDAPVPPGAILIRLDTALGSGGLSNAGEPVFLRDPRGRRVSAAPAVAPPDPGVCLIRASSDGRTDDREAFAFDALGGCTPGLPDRMP